jgi:hypothetical protein
VYEKVINLFLSLKRHDANKSTRKKKIINGLKNNKSEEYFSTKKNNKVKFSISLLKVRFETPERPIFILGRAIT